MCLKLSDPKKFNTPAPGAYKPENSESYLDDHISHSMGIKLNDPKKYKTPALVLMIQRSPKNILTSIFPIPWASGSQKPRNT
jgi:hypothetical protein